MATDKVTKASAASPRAKKQAQAASPKSKPSRSEQRVLDAHYKTPSPTTVSRALGVSERNVRRIRDRFQDQLDERWKQRDAEQQALEDARLARVQAWIDEGLDRAMAVIDGLLESSNESIRLRAAKVRIELALRRSERRAARMPNELTPTDARPSRRA